MPAPYTMSQEGQIALPQLKEELRRILLLYLQCAYMDKNIIINKYMYSALSEVNQQCNNIHHNYVSTLIPNAHKRNTLACSSEEILYQWNQHSQFRQYCHMYPSM